MTPLAAGFAAKGLLIHMTSGSVTTGLAHSKFIILTDQALTLRAMFRHILLSIQTAIQATSRPGVFNV